MNDIIEMLDVIPADDRDTWIRIGMALKNHMGDSGLTLWDQWSQKSEKYDPKGMMTQWRSFKQSGGITIGSLYHMAHAYGYQMGKHEVTRVKQNYENRKREIELENQKREDRQKEAAKIALDHLGTCTIQQGHPYMVKKGLPGEHVMVDKDRNLVVGLFSEPGKLWSIQKIDGQGNKRFYPYGCRTGGCYFPLGNRNAEMVWLCEGLATGYTIHRILRDHCNLDDLVMVSFSSGNMKKMAEKLKKDIRDSFESVKYVAVVADNDKPTDELHDRDPIYIDTHGRTVAVQTGFTVLCPSTLQTDFNDLYNDYYQFEEYDGVHRMSNYLMQTRGVARQYDYPYKIKPQVVSDGTHLVAPIAGQNHRVIDYIQDNVTRMFIIMPNGYYKKTLTKR